jgi:hypothetical protein
MITVCTQLPLHREDRVHRAPSRLADRHRAATGGLCSPDRDVGRQMRRSPQLPYTVRTLRISCQRGWRTSAVPRRVASGPPIGAGTTNATIGAATLHREDGAHRAPAWPEDRRRAAAVGLRLPARERPTRTRCHETWNGAVGLSGCQDGAGPRPPSGWIFGPEARFATTRTRPMQRGTARASAVRRRAAAASAATGAGAPACVRRGRRAGAVAGGSRTAFSRNDPMHQCAGRQDRDGHGPRRTPRLAVGRTRNAISRKDPMQQCVGRQDRDGLGPHRMPRLVPRRLAWCRDRWPGQAQP